MPAPDVPSAFAAQEEITLSILALNDLHGRLVALPWFGGYANHVRAERERDGGGVLLVDAGDMFQGSLESNLSEGASVIAAYRVLGMHAAALGNHEFDFGPVGEGKHGDPQGAIKARLLEAGFPVLAANLVDRSTGVRPAWPGLAASVLRTVAGVRIGIVGALTRYTSEIVMPAFFRDLEVVPIAPALEREASALREWGAEVVVAVVHAGGECERFEDPADLSSCDPDAEIAHVIDALAPGTVDAVVAGHTHGAVAHFMRGVPVVEAYARGRAFSRVDLVIDGASHKVVRAVLHPPAALCPDVGASECAPAPYEGAAVVADPQVAAAIAPALEQAREKRAELLGPVLRDGMKRAHDAESALGNLLADLTREAVPRADAAVLNAGGLRAHLRGGPLDYGALFEVMPFDNRLAQVTLTAEEFTRVLARHLTRKAHGIVSLSGLSLAARCEGKELRVVLRRANGRRVRPDERLRVATSDYLATGGDGLFTPEVLRAAEVESDLGTILRDAMAERLRARREIDPRGVYDPAHPRLNLPGPRPVRCE